MDQCYGDTCGLSADNKSAVKSIFEKTLEFNPLHYVWEMRYGYEENLASPIFPVILSISFYFICITPFMIFDMYGKNWKWIQQYKIQPTKQVEWRHIKHAVARNLWNQFVYILPISMAQWIWMKPEYLPDYAPTLFEVWWQCLASLFVFDFEYWFWHATHHKVRFLYKYVHALHHEFYAPFSWVTQHLHPWELLSVGVFTVTSPWIFGAHPLTQWIFQCFAIWVSVECHIGYDLPLMPHRYLPDWLWGGCIKHDMHHQRPLTNFAPFYGYLDYLTGTHCPGRIAGGVKSEALKEYDRKIKEKKLVKEFDMDVGQTKWN